MEHFRWFADLVMRFQDNVDFVRALARRDVLLRIPSRRHSASWAEQDAIVAELVSTDVEPHIARTLALAGRYAGTSVNSWV